jgi:flagellar hook-associated protein 2
MAGLGLSGLISGVDTASIVDQLMALERQGQTRSTYRQKHTYAQANGLDDVKTKLTALKSAATALRDVGTWTESQSVSSADASRVGVTRTGGAPIGTYGVRVTQLSSAAQKTYSWTESAAATTLTLNDSDGATAPVQLALPANAKIADVAAAINGKSESPVYAAVVGEKLVLSSRATGAAADFSVTGASLSAVQKSFEWTPSATPGTITLDDADVGTPAIDIAIAADATIADVAQAINDAASSPATAAVVNGKLVLSGKANGAAGEFSLGGTQLRATHPIPGKDAKYFLDGDPTEHSSPTNIVKNAVPGVTLTLKGTTTDSVAITAGAPALDQDQIKSRVRAFVDAYNGVVTLARTELAEKKVLNPTSDFQAGQGALYGDTGVISMQSRLRQAMGQRHTGVGNAATLDDLSDIGISSGRIGGSVEEAKSGLLRIDETKLSAAIAGDTQAVRRLFGGGSTPGFAQDVEKLVDSLTETIDTRVEAINKQAKRIGDAITAAETRLEAKQKRLTAQFAAMESALGSAQTQQTWLTGQIAALTGSTKS